MKKYKKNKFIKFSKKNIFNLITIFISLIALFQSSFSNYYQKKQFYLDKYPDIKVETINFNCNLYYYNNEYYTMPDSHNVNININNIGNGTAKNLKFKWNEENSVNLRNIINNYDEKKVISFDIDDNFMTYHFEHVSGGFLISSSNYKRNIDYLLPQKDEKSVETISFPIEYTIYFEAILLLSNENIDKALENLNLYLDLEYKDIDNEIYYKTLVFKVSYEKVKRKDSERNVDYYQYKFILSQE